MDRFAAATISIAMIAIASMASADPPSLGAVELKISAVSQAEPRVPSCQFGQDHIGPYIYHPENECCSTVACGSGTGTNYKRWTRECVATAPGQPIIITGFETVTSLGLSGGFKYQSESCFANDLPGSQNVNGDNWRTYIFDIEAKAAAASKPNPLMFLSSRQDIVDAYDLGTSDPDFYSFDRDWLLKTNRAWEGANSVTAYFAGLAAGAGFSGCRYPTNVSANPAGGDLWNETSGCATAESLKTPYIMSGLSAEARQNTVYYVFFRDGTTQRSFYPSGMMADLTNPNYREWLIRYTWLRMEREHMDGFEMAHKLHRWWSAANRSRFEPWIVTGDGLGVLNGATKRLCPGTGGSDDTNVSTLAEISNAVGATNPCDYLLTGMPLIRATDSDYPVDTEFVYPMYVDGLQKLGHLAYTHEPRMHYVTHVNPYWYDRCTAGVVFNAANGYTDPSCVDAATGYEKFDDPATVGVNEAALIRQWVQEGGYMVIDRDDGVNAGGAINNGMKERPPANCNPLPCDGGIGSGAGSGLSSVQLKEMIEGSSPAPVRVEVYDSSYPRSTAPKISGQPWQVNPEAVLSVVAFQPECSDGADNDADGFTDYPDDPHCVAADDTDETTAPTAACGDGYDNDADGDIDYPADSGCSALGDPTES